MRYTHSPNKVWSKGGDLEARDKHGETPIMLAAEAGGSVLSALYDAGATPDVDATDETGRTALHLAAIAGNTDEVSVLL